MTTNRSDGAPQPKTVSRRAFLGTTAGTAALVGLAVNEAAGAQNNTSPNAPEFVETRTRYGRLRGARANGVIAFKGVPYAGPVAGTGRFKPAPPLSRTNPSQRPTRPRSR